MPCLCRKTRRLGTCEPPSLARPTQARGRGKRRARRRTKRWPMPRQPKRWLHIRATHLGSGEQDVHRERFAVPGCPCPPICPTRLGCTHLHGASPVHMPVVKPCDALTLCRAPACQTSSSCITLARPLLLLPRKQRCPQPSRPPRQRRQRKTSPRCSAGEGVARCVSHEVVLCATRGGAARFGDVVNLYVVLMQCVVC